MRLLVVEGNRKETWQKREALGGVPYHKRFQAMLRILQPKAEVAIAFPADDDTLLPSVNQLRSFQGVLWTGSSLHVNDPSPAIWRQLAFAEDVFKSGVPFYGSCWGLQVATKVAGGQVASCLKGREFGITKPIELMDSGKQHVYFKGRTEKYSALCLHLDEIVKLPENSEVLARNDHSEVQALTIRYKNSEFFGVQYHPEFLVSDLVFIARQMSQSLFNEGIFETEEGIANFISDLEDPSNFPSEISNYSLHIQEVKSWLDCAVRPTITKDYQRNQNFMLNGQFSKRNGKNVKNDVSNIKPSP